MNSHIIVRLRAICGLACDFYRHSPVTPGAGPAFEHSGDRGAATATACLPAIQRQIPGRKLVPVPADQDVTAAIAVGARADKVMDIARVDISEPVINRDVT